MQMLCFELTMPSRASWNGRWSGENSKHIIIKKFLKKDQDAVNKILETKDYFYRWDDGWCACVTATAIDGKQANRLRKMNAGFCGYDWMVQSILRYNKIMAPSDWV